MKRRVLIVDDEPQIRDMLREWLTRTPNLAREPILPKIAPVGSSLHIVMPHDPEYAQLPGDTSGVPERVHAFPRRFIRTGKRWVPQT